MDRIIMKERTLIFIYNENGFIDSESLEHFSLEFAAKSMFDFDIKWKSDIDSMSSIFSILCEDDLDLIIYDYGYVLKAEGSILKTILLLRDLDKYLEESIAFYISPTQVVENQNELLYKRGSDLKSISLFLDKLFSNREYSKALSNL
jgi:hypothetical protein